MDSTEYNNMLPITVSRLRDSSKMQAADTKNTFFESGALYENFLNDGSNVS